MPWTDIDERNYSDAIRLLGLIDAGESYLLEQGAEDDYHGWTVKRYFHSEAGFGVMIACLLGESLHIGLSFDTDVPSAAEDEIVELLRGLEKSKIWCRAENERLIALISHTLSVNPDYWAHEMSISKDGFRNWKEPEMPADFRLSGYCAGDHRLYIDLLEEAMAHVSAKGTFIERSDSLKKAWTDPSERNYFLSLWDGEKLVGICHGNGLEIVNLAVGEAYRSRGFGYTLLYSAVKHAYQERDETGLLCLYVVDSNIRAYGFYLHSGMKVSGHAARFSV